MKRIKLISSPNFYRTWNAEWVYPIAEQHFEFEEFDSTQHYPTGTVVFIHDHEHRNAVYNVPQLVERGINVVISALQEYWSSVDTIPGCCYLKNSKFWLYNESLWWKHLKYDQYRRQKIPNKVALMPMNSHKKHRDFVMSQLETWLENTVWSYGHRGLRLPGDSQAPIQQVMRYMIPEWYDQTYCSFVVESQVQPGYNNTPFITEKTFKPLAFWHPFLIYGSYQTLKELRSWGFETFGNIWDESYDEIKNPVLRGLAVIEQLKSTVIQPHSAETMEKLQHNHNRFFDTDLALKGLLEIISDVKELTRKTTWQKFE